MEHHTITRQHVSRETYQKTVHTYKQHETLLKNYLDQLLWWNERINLVSRNVSRGTIREHLIHSLLLSQFDAFQSAPTVIDAGTGGGLPGLPLAVTHPSKQFLLNDIVSKKCLAIKQMLRKLGLTNVQTADYSIEHLQKSDPFLLITKHAFKIGELFNMTSRLPWRKTVFYKGMDFKKELEEVDTPLCVTVHDLSGLGDFYNGKAIIEIERR